MARSKEHLRDHSNYVKTLCELAQQSPSYTQTLEQQATGGMDEVGQESKVAIELPYISKLISDAWKLTASLCCGFTSALTLMSPTIHPFFALKIADAIILYACEMLKIFNRHLNHKYYNNSKDFMQSFLIPCMEVQYSLLHYLLLIVTIMV